MSAVLSAAIGAIILIAFTWFAIAVYVRAICEGVKSNMSDWMGGGGLLALVVVIMNLPVF